MAMVTTKKKGGYNSKSMQDVKLMTSWFDRKCIQDYREHYFIKYHACFNEKIYHSISNHIFIKFC